MIVCSCNIITDCDVRALLGPRPAATSTAQVYRGLGHQPQCGRCAGSIRKIVDEGLSDGAASS